MKKIFILSIIGSLFLMSSVFAEPYKGKTFPEKQVVKHFCGGLIKGKNIDCLYLGKRGGEADYDVFFMIDSKNEMIRSGVISTRVSRLDTGIWIIGSKERSEIVQE